RAPQLGGEPGIRQGVGACRRRNGAHHRERPRAREADHPRPRLTQPREDSQDRAAEKRHGPATPLTSRVFPRASASTRAPQHQQEAKVEDMYSTKIDTTYTK